ncbi:unnamed protein product [Dovyalis caffra]|uniref:Uncharacterized protein n=1 Tax=Dovyalis caffra TaxID=77055 RepID=A0AAV1RU37_9ROSI|nr:unnamed protein product [Dovyalis caffra]
MQEIHIKETTPIHPSTPPFSQDHTLPPSHLDTNRNLNVTFRYFCVYVNTTTNANHPSDVIAAAPSSALVHYYPLAATLCRGQVVAGLVEDIGLYFLFWIDIVP